MASRTPTSPSPDRLLSPFPRAPSTRRPRRHAALIATRSTHARVVSRDAAARRAAARSRTDQLDRFNRGRQVFAASSPRQRTCPSFNSAACTRDFRRHGDDLANVERTSPSNDARVDLAAFGCGHPLTRRRCCQPLPILGDSVSPLSSRILDGALRRRPRLSSTLLGLAASTRLSERRVGMIGGRSTLRRGDRLARPSPARDRWRSSGRGRHRSSCSASRSSNESSDSARGRIVVGALRSARSSGAS